MSIECYDSHCPRHDSQYMPDSGPFCSESECILCHPSSFITPLQQRFNWRRFRFEFGRYYGWTNEAGQEEKWWVWASEEKH